MSDPADLDGDFDARDISNMDKDLQKKNIFFDLELVCGLQSATQFISPFFPSVPSDLLHWLKCLPTTEDKTTETE